MAYVCYNCTDVANAKKNIDPAHPKAKDASPTQTKSGSSTGAGDANWAVILGGSLINLPTAAGGTSAGTGSAPSVGAKLNLSV
jgi:hypothetical protein